MSALPNPLHSTTPAKKKPAGRVAKANKYGRDPQSPSERMRVSDPDTLAPFCPVPMSFLSDIPRLTSGNSCTVLLMVLWAKSAGRGAKKGESRPEWTQELAVCDLAQICRCDERTIERELKALGERGLGEVKKEGKGKISARLLYRDWEKLPDYKSNVVEMSPAEDAPEVDGEPKEKREGFQQLTGKKPLAVKAGARSKAIPVQVGVRTVQFETSGSVDIEFACVITKGEQVIRAAVPDAFLELLRKQISSSNVSNELNSGTRHARRDDRVNHSGVVKDHHRAGEVGRIFDPLLEKVGGRLLSADKTALHSACESLADTPKDFLLHFLHGKGGRAERPVKSPLACAAICGECRQNWEKSRGADQDTAERDKLVAFLGLPRMTRESLKYGGVAKYIDSCRKIVGDPDCTREQQDAARVLGRLLAG